jgi:hypothetical protein
LAGSSFRVHVLHVPLPRDMFSEDYLAQLLPSLAPEVQPLAWQFPLINGKVDLLCRYGGRLTLAELKIVGPKEYEAGLAQLAKYAGGFRKMLELLGVDLPFNLLLIMGVPKGMERYVQQGPFSVEGVEVEGVRMEDLRVKLAEEVEQLIQRRSELSEEVKRLEEKVQELQKAVKLLDASKERRRVQKLLEEENRRLQELRREARRLKDQVAKLREERLEVLPHRNEVWLRRGSTCILIGWIRDGVFTPHENYQMMKGEIEPKHQNEVMGEVGFWEQVCREVEELEKTGFKIAHGGLNKMLEEERLS